MSTEDVVKQRLKMYMPEMRLERFSGTVQCVKDAQNFGRLSKFYSENI